MTDLFAVQEAAERLVDAEIARDNALGALLDLENRSDDRYESYSEALKEATMESDNALVALAELFNKKWPPDDVGEELPLSPPNTDDLIDYARSQDDGCSAMSFDWIDGKPTSVILIATEKHPERLALLHALHESWYPEPDQ